MRLTWSAPIMPSPTMPTRKSGGGSAVVIVTPVCLRGCVSVKLCGSAVGGPIGEAWWSPVDDGRFGGGQDRLQRPLGDREGGVDAAAEHVLLDDGEDVLIECGDGLDDRIERRDPLIGLDHDAGSHGVAERGVGLEHIEDHEDRKSTRLNSSHVSISYAVFCLKKKK